MQELELKREKSYLRLRIVFFLACFRFKNKKKKVNVFSYLTI